MESSKFNNLQDYRTILSQSKTNPFVGQIFCKFGNQVCFGSASLIKIGRKQKSEIKQDFQEKQQLTQYKNEVEKSLYLIITAAHVLTRKNPRENKIEYAQQINIILGKYQSIDNIEILNDENNLKLNLNPESILIPTKNQNDSSQLGFDVCLIGLDQSNRKKVNQYLLQNYCKTPKELNANVDLINIIKNEVSLRVQGYPGEMRNQGYPQVYMEQQFEEARALELIKQAKQKNIIFYDQIQTSAGQAGSPITLITNQHDILIGLHTGKDNCVNFGTYFQDFSGLRKLFKEDVIFYGANYKFDQFLENQKIQQLGQN